MSSIERQLVGALFAAAFMIIIARAFLAVRDLVVEDVTAFLAFPLTVVLPALAFIYVGQLKNLVSDEGALMQLGVLIQLLLILALPSLALYLVLGFPVVFLVVELFETKVPAGLKADIKRRILA